MENANMMDPWARTVGLLGKASNVVIDAGGAAHRHAKPCRTGAWMGGLVTVIDRPTPSTATIAWRDPTRGCLGDQVWRLTRARRLGFCAISRRAIGPGDAVYKPDCRAAPVNADAMILACVINDVVIA